MLKVVIKTLLCYSPLWLKSLLLSWNKKREKTTIMNRVSRTHVTREEIHCIIGALDLNSDVMLHTSRSNIGDLDGGSEYVVNEFLNKIDITKHTLLVSALPYRGTFMDYLKQHAGMIFDVRTAPIAMGSINQCFASLKDAQRSVHPTHSVVAIGKDATSYVSEHHLDSTPFGEHSPYWKLIENKGKVVLFGATLNNLTCVCAVEDLLGDIYTKNIYAKQCFNVNCIDMAGNSVEVTTVCHDPRKAINRSLTFIHDDLINQNIMEVYPLGEAEVAVIDILSFARFYLKLLDSGVSNRGKIKVDGRLHEKIEWALKKLDNIG